MKKSELLRNQKCVETTLRNLHDVVKSLEKLKSAGILPADCRLVLRENKKLITKLTKQLAKIKIDLRAFPKKRAVKVKYRGRNLKKVSKRKNVDKTYIETQPVEVHTTASELRKLTEGVKRSEYANLGMRKGQLTKLIKQKQDEIEKYREFEIAQLRSLRWSLPNRNAGEITRAVVADHIREVRIYRRKQKELQSDINRIERMIANKQYVKRAKKAN